VASRRLLADLTPLRESSAYRRLWLGSSLSSVGSQMTQFAVALQVYLLTHSSAAVGVVGLVSAIPAITCGLLGGTVIDAVDRRRLVLFTSSLLALTSAALALQALAQLDQLWLLYVLVAVQSLLGSINAPARRTFMPRLLPPDQVPAGVALTMLTMHLSLVIGPTLAGLLTAAGGLKLCYLLDAASFLAALYGVFRLPAMRPEGGAVRPSLRAVLEGLRFLRRSQVLYGALLADVNATLLAMPFALFPAINAERFGGSPRTLGLLTASVAVGGILGSGLSGPVGRVTRQGRAMLIAGAIWGLSLAGFGMAHALVPTLVFLLVAGIADVSSVVLRSTIIQVGTPDAYRGRISAAEFVVGASVPELGNFRAGAIGSLTSPGFSAVVGGLAAAAGTAVLALAVPALVRYDGSSTSVSSSDQPVRR
jgi:MFS family permease